LVWPFLERADVLVVPSRLDEPFGNTAVEGALAARPVIATRTSGLLEATDGFDAAVMAPPGDPGALAAAVDEVVARWDELRDAAARDARHAATRFSPATYRARIVDIAADACSHAPAPASSGPS
jgi:glycosyltransferase involved in cell wall biosynthesis